MGPLRERVPIVGAGAVSTRGLGWRGLSHALASRPCEPEVSAELATSHPGTRSFEVKALAEPTSVVERRARPLMSRSAVLASMATNAALQDAPWQAPLDDVGFYLGVGASGGSIDQLAAMLAASLEGGDFELPRFGDRGLAACNPLFAFQLMNNFTLCHSAIVHGTQGANAAFFSRGTGTLFALREAVDALSENDCERALAGGADSSVHPVTWAELVRDGWAERGLVPGEGAALLALAQPAASVSALGFLDYVSVRSTRRDALATALQSALDELALPSIDAVVLAAWGPPARDALSSVIAKSLRGRPLLDLAQGLGESLAASPALGWAVALDLLCTQGLGRVLVLSAGLDADLGIVGLSAGASP